MALPSSRRGGGRGAWWPSRSGRPRCRRAAPGLARNAGRARLGVGTDQGAGTWGLGAADHAAGHRLPGDRARPGAWRPDRPGGAGANTRHPGRAALRVVDTHLTHRYRMPVQLALLVHRLGGSSLPTVLAGDLNMPRPGRAGGRGFRSVVRGRSFPARQPLVHFRSHAAGGGGRRSDGRGVWSRESGSDRLQRAGTAQPGVTPAHPGTAGQGGPGEHMASRPAGGGGPGRRRPGRGLERGFQDQRLAVHANRHGRPSGSRRSWARSTQPPAAEPLRLAQRPAGRGTGLA